MFRRSTFAVALAGVLAFSTTVARAQENTAPVRLLVGFSAGGALDSVARALAERLRVPSGSLLPMPSAP